MYTIFFLALLQAAFAQSTSSCPACDNLLSLWNPDANTGSCLGNFSDPVAYIVGAEQCLCGTQGQSDYSACVACNINGDGGVPIDGLNFGNAAGYQTACAIFASDVTSILEPSGLNAFASVVAGVTTATDVFTADILGYYIFQNVVSATDLTGLITDTVGATPVPTVTPTATETTATHTSTNATNKATTGSTSKATGTGTASLTTGVHTSDSGKLGVRSFVGIAVLVALLALV